jgi:hypothetical protein
MARIFVFMSLLFATLFSLNSTAAEVWTVQSKLYPRTIDRTNETVTFNIPNVVPYGENACLKGTFSAIDKIDGNSYSGALRMNGSDCKASWDRVDGSRSGYGYKLSTLTRNCDAGMRPQDINNLDCTNFEDIQCPQGQAVDPVTGECVLSDGEADPTDPDNDDGSGGDGSGGDGSGNDPSDFDCNTSESCLSEAQLICETGNRSLMEYQYLGSGYYDYQCGYQEYDCGDGFSWDRVNQVCKSDQDQDGTPDDQDPEPENPEENGDRDGDGVPNGQDSHPDDPEQWNGNPQSNHNGQNVNPIGESETFNDSSIVEALNQNTQTTNTTNSKLDSLLEQGSISNDELGQINDGLQGLTDALGQEEPTGKGSGDLNDAVGEALDDFEQMTIDEFNEGIDDNLLVEQGDLPTIETAFGGLELEKCEDITNDLFTLELCSLAPRINPILYWAFACFTVIACFQNVSATLKKENR